MDRRAFLGVLSAGVAQAWCPRCFAAPRPRGCVRSAALGLAAMPTRASTSGLADVDRLCLGEAEKLNRVFGVKAGFGFFDDAGGANALALEVAYDRALKDGTVLLGRRLVDLIAARSSRLEQGLIAVLAHEWGHIRQYKSGLKADWSVHYELSADYLAGWYMTALGDPDAAQRRAAMQVFEALGDTEFTDDDHHGTPAQRAKIFALGLGPEPAAGEPAAPKEPPDPAEALASSLHFFN